jgi:hypothetical protein
VTQHDEARDREKAYVWLKLLERLMKEVDPRGLRDDERARLAAVMAECSRWLLASTARH